MDIRAAHVREYKRGEKGRGGRREIERERDRVVSNESGQGEGVRERGSRWSSYLLVVGARV